MFGVFGCSCFLWSLFSTFYKLNWPQPWSWRPCHTLPDRLNVLYTDVQLSFLSGNGTSSRFEIQQWWPAWKYLQLTCPWHVTGRCNSQSVNITDGQQQKHSEHTWTDERRLSTGHILDKTKCSRNNPNWLPLSSPFTICCEFRACGEFSIGLGVTRGMSLHMQQSCWTYTGHAVNFEHESTRHWRI